MKHRCHVCVLGLDMLGGRLLGVSWMSWFGGAPQILAGLVCSGYSKGFEAGPFDRFATGFIVYIHFLETQTMRHYSEREKPGSSYNSSEPSW